MSDQNVPFLAPGCFGSAIHYQCDSMVCAACPFAEQCEPQHVLALAAMRERLGIKAPVIRRRPVKTSPVEGCEDTGRMTLPKKVRELLERLDRESFDIVGKMKRGENPFAGHSSYRYLMVACHLMMRLDFPVTHKVLSAGLEKHMKWSKGTADAHARMATQALMHVGAIKENQGTFFVPAE